MEPKFVEFHRWEDEPICIKKEDISAFYPDPNAYKRDKIPTIITTGTNTYTVNESYDVVKKILGLEEKEKVYQIPFKEPDKERIEKTLEEWRRKYYDVMPLNTNSFSEVKYKQSVDGMTDDEWHRAIAGFSD